MSKFCEECGGQFTSESSKFCGSCGARRRDALVGEQNLETRVIQLTQQLQDENLDSSTIDSILDAHAACFEADLCDVCDYFDESGEDTHVLYDLANKKSLTPDQQQVVLAAAFSWQGRSEGVCMQLASSRGISDECKELLLGDLMWTNYGDDFEETVQDFLDVIRDNPRFTADEIATFVKFAREDHELDVK
jgi:hypothetical protein